MLTIFIVVLIVLVGSALCSSSEAAIFSVSELKVKALVAENRPGAKTLLKAKQNIHSTVSTIVILNNLFNIGGSLIIGHLTSEVLNDAWLGVFSAFLTLFIILVGEIFPKNIGQRNAIAVGLFTAGPINFLSKLLFPILWLVNQFSKLFNVSEENSTTSEAEIKMLIDLGSKQNQIEQDEQELLQNVFKLNDKQARDIMTPRVNIVALDADLTLDEQKDIIYNSSHSRLPIFREDYDTIIGFVLLREVLQALAEDKPGLKPEDFLHELATVREDTKVDSLLFIFKKKRVHIALVSDPFKGTSGIVTLEDVIEELVGEIVDETDKVVDMRAIGAN
jgi:CBS domain containing-hemolysin-like protein